jgi:hypothetical protein
MHFYIYLLLTIIFIVHYNTQMPLFTNATFYVPVTTLTYFFFSFVLFFFLCLIKAVGVLEQLTVIHNTSIDVLLEDVCGYP